MTEEMEKTEVTQHSAIQQESWSADSANIGKMGEENNQQSQPQR